MTCIFLSDSEDLLEIVVVDQCVASRIGGQRGQTFLRSEQRTDLAERRPSVEDRCSPAPCAVGPAARRQRNQAATVDRVETRIVAVRKIGGHTHLLRVLDGVGGQAGSEVENRFPAGDVPEGFGQRLERKELLVRIEQRKLGLIGDELAAGIGRAAVVGVEFGVDLAEFVDGGQQGVAIRGHVAQQIQTLIEDGDRRRVVGREACLQEMPGRFLDEARVLQVHAAQVEEEDEDALVRGRYLRLSRRFLCRLLQSLVGRGDGLSGCRTPLRFARQGGGQRNRHLLEVGDGLRDTLLRYRKVVRRKAANRSAARIDHANVHQDEIRESSEARLLLGQDGSRHDQEQAQECDAPSKHSPLETEPEVQLDRSHRTDGRHLTESTTVHDRVDRGVVDMVEHVLGSEGDQHSTAGFAE